MRVVIKPAGLLILVTVIAALSCLVFFGRSRPQSVAEAQPPVAQSPETKSDKDLYAGAIWTLNAGDATTASMKELTASVPGVGEPVKIYSLQIIKPTENPWGISLHLPTPSPIKKGEKLRITLRARSADKVPFIVNFEQNAEPYNKSTTQTINTTPEWEQYTVDFEAVEDYDVEKSHTTFHCGAKKGLLEIADLHLNRVK